jgi:hypothetical protein
MGRCETATASIGIKILLSDLVLQINETNFALIKEMLDAGFIEDKNDYFNEVYRDIIDCNELDPDNVSANYSDVKQYLINEFKNKGSLSKSKFSSEVKHTLKNGSLLDKHLLVPVKEILETERWGYERYGINSSSRSMDFDLSVDIDKYKEIEKTEIVFILWQSSG